LPQKHFFFYGEDGEVEEGLCYRLFTVIEAAVPQSNLRKSIVVGNGDYSRVESCK